MIGQVNQNQKYAAVSTAVRQLESASRWLEDLRTRIGGLYGYRDVATGWGVTFEEGSKVEGDVIKTPYGSAKAIITNLIESDHPQVRYAFRMVPSLGDEQGLRYPEIWSVLVDPNGTITSHENGALSLDNLDEAAVHTFIKNLTISLVYAIGTRSNAQNL